MQQPLPVDFGSVLADIAFQLGEEVPDGRRRIPVGTPTMAKHLEVSRSTLLRWMDGSRPKYEEGEHMLIEWSKLTGKPLEFAPRLSAVAAAKVARREADTEASEEVGEDTGHDALSAVALSWGRG